MRHQKPIGPLLRPNFAKSNSRYKNLEVTNPFYYVPFVSLEIQVFYCNPLIRTNQRGVLFYVTDLFSRFLWTSECWKVEKLFCPLCTSYLALLSKVCIWQDYAEHFTTDWCGSRRKYKNSRRRSSSWSSEKLGSDV